MKTHLLKTNDPIQLKTRDFVHFPTDTTPGDVGICISGGGMRSLTAGMGQLRGLMALKNKRGDLISQSRLLSTVSGGSWLGTTFVHLPVQYSDQAFLGDYMTPSAYTLDSIKVVSDKAIASHATHGTSLPSLGLQLLLLILLGVPKNDIWKTIVGTHLLKPYGLYHFDLLKKQETNNFFTYDHQTRLAIVRNNPQLKNETAHLVKQDNQSVRRPYWICNFSMFVNQPGDSFRYLVPVQATAYYTGIYAHPNGATDVINGQAVGGGGAESFSFNSILESRHDTSATISQNRQFSLADAIATSSATYASKLENLGNRWKRNFKHFLEDASPIAQEAAKAVGELITDQSAFEPLISKLTHQQLSEQDTDGKKITYAIKALTDLVPHFQYWPVSGPVNNTTMPTPFADGGNLENTGIAASLTYVDVHQLIAFINCATPLVTSAYGILDENDQPIAGTTIMIDAQLPPLFGYRPYDQAMGYQLYKNSDPSKDRMFKYNQVFPSEAFQELLKGLWEVSGNLENPGSNQYGANYKQELTTVANQWLGVKGARNISVLWVYNNLIRSWYDQLSDDIKSQIFNNNPNSYYNFPHYSTNDTQLTPEQVNMLAGQAAWNIVEGSSELFLSMYQA